MPIVDIVGHFGTAYSYATVASRVARSLREVGALGSVTNLDPEWHQDHADLNVMREERGSHVFVVAVPHHYLDAYPAIYGAKRSAIFMSPNTDALSVEHTRTCRKFGLAIAPSVWCADVVRRITYMDRVECLPLGFDDDLLHLGERWLQERWRRARQPPRFLHFSTDAYWPGRKGTEELLSAWVELRKSEPDAELLLHVPPSLHADTVSRVRQLDLEDHVSVRRGLKHGGGDQLRDLLEWADLLVAPSRCEGFGIMLLSALAAGLPLVSTYTTGHVDFLAQLDGWLGVPTGLFSPLAGEEGYAPSLSARVLYRTMRAAMSSDVRSWLLADLAGQRGSMREWTWSARAEAYRDALLSWMEG